MSKTKRNKRTSLQARKGTIQNFKGLLLADALTRIHDIQVAVRKNKNRVDMLYVTKDGVTLEYSQSKTNLEKDAIHFVSVSYKDRKGNIVSYTVDNCPTYLTPLLQRINCKYVYQNIHTIIENTVYTGKQINNLMSMDDTSRLDLSAEIFGMLEANPNYMIKHNSYIAEITAEDNPYCRITIEVTKDLMIKVSSALSNFEYMLSNEFSQSLNNVNEFIAITMRELVRYSGEVSPNDLNDLFNTIRYIYPKLYVHNKFSSTENQLTMNEFIGNKIEEIVMLSTKEIEVYSHVTDAYTLSIQLTQMDNQDISYLESQDVVKITYTTPNDSNVYVSDFVYRSEWKFLINKIIVHLSSIGNVVYSG